MFPTQSDNWSVWVNESNGLFVEGDVWAEAQFIIIKQFSKNALWWNEQSKHITGT